MHSPTILLTWSVSPSPGQAAPPPPSPTPPNPKPIPPPPCIPGLGGKCGGDTGTVTTKEKLNPNTQSLPSTVAECLAAHGYCSLAVGVEMDVLTAVAVDAEPCCDACAQAARKKLKASKLKMPDGYSPGSGGGL
jgi:hypothetical protein